MPKQESGRRKKILIMREAKEVLEKSKERVIYHYTSMEALKGILKENELCFWGTRYDSMNDPTEYIYAKESLMPKLCKYFDEEEITGTEIYPYVVSFSEAEHDFIMWRMYKAEVALVLDYNVIKNWVEKHLNLENKEESYYFGDCKYPETDDILIRDFEQLLKWNKERGDMSEDETTYLELTTFIKRKEFKNENEVRLFTCDYNLPTSIYNEQNPAEPIMKSKERAKDIHIKSVRNKDFVLYKEFHLPKDALKGIIINCAEGDLFDKVKRHIQAWLYQLKYETDSIHIRHTKTGNLIINF